MAPPRHLVVVGGVAGGMSAAARARRLDESLRITVLEKGPDVSFANCALPYYVAGLVPDRDDLLVQTPETLRRRFAIDARVGHEAVAIDRARRAVVVRPDPRVRDALPPDTDFLPGDPQGRYVLPYDKLILSPGARPVLPDAAGLDHPRVRTIRNVADVDAVVAFAAEQPGAPALVVGAGYIGLEMAEALVLRGLPATLATHGDRILGQADPEMTAPLLDALDALGVRLRRRATVRSVSDSPRAESSGDGAPFAGARVAFDDGRTERFALVVVAVGVVPDAGLAERAGLALGRTGGIAVDEFFRTSDPDILAIGDAVEVRHRPTGEPALIPLAGPANRQGRMAADNLFGVARPYPGSFGASVVKVGGAMLAMTGATEKQLARLGRAAAPVYVHPASRAGYYPGSVDYTLKVMVDPGTGAVLGAQASGPADSTAEKAIDALTAAMAGGGDVHALAANEHAYAPPFAGSRSPLNLAGFVAQDALAEGAFPVGPAAAWALAGRGGDDGEHALLDVRSPGETAEGMLRGARTIPVDALRARWGELDRGREYWVYCESGIRSHAACRLLAQRGVACRNVGGGYAAIRMLRRATGEG